MYVLLNGIHTFLLSHHRWRSLTFAAVEAKKKVYVHLFFLFLLRRPFSILSVLAGANYQEKMQRKTQREDTGETISMLLVLRFHGGSKPYLHLQELDRSNERQHWKPPGIEVAYTMLWWWWNSALECWKPASSICALSVYLSIDQGRVADYYFSDRKTRNWRGKLRDRSMLWLIGFMTELSISWSVWY